MKMKKLSLVTILAMNVVFAGGDMAPVEAPIVVISGCNKDTTISGKAVTYYYTDDTVDYFDKDSSALAGAVTLNVSHKLFDGITTNFSAIGYTSDDDSFYEGKKRGAFFNVANITATFGDTTLIAGRQLIDSPMFGSFDWLIAPSSFEAYTLVNKSVSDLTLIGTYVRTHRAFNAGDNFKKLTDINDGNNFALGAIYGKDALNASVWYYNIDAGDYTQVYADAGYNFGSISVAAQVVTTDYATSTDATAYGVKVGTKVAGINLTAAMNMISDATTGYVDRDGLYTSTWNQNASTKAVANDDALSWKVGASTTLASANLSAAYAAHSDEGSELDVVAGYNITDSVNLGVVYSLTDYDVDVDKSDAVSALEVFATYTF